MTPEETLLLTGVVTTSALSGALGMGGGMLLMGLYGALLPAPQALALHGLTQVVANGARAAGLRDAVCYPVLRPYLGGAALAAAVFGGVAYRPSTRGIFLVLGALPFVAARLPEVASLRADRPRRALGCGVVVGGLHLLAGVSGPVLDLFFLRSPLDRRRVVATKAATQALSHALKAAFFLAAAGPAAAPRPAFLAAVWAAAIAGTRLGRVALERMDEARFRALGAGLLRGVGAVYLARGLAGFLR